jgi:hypothetical protein
MSGGMKTSLSGVRRFFFRARLYAGCALCLSPLFPAKAQLIGIRQASHDTWMQQAHQIAVAMVAYAADNNQTYPDGKSSTEVFQKLMDGGYVTDPATFYIAMPGKTPVTGGQKLKPENVCFDVTSGIDSDASDGIPVVFMTGYKITYTADAAAVPLAKPAPPGTVVAYKDNAAKFLPAGSDGSIVHFVPANFNANGKTYRQLTPAGTLP